MRMALTQNTRNAALSEKPAFSNGLRAVPELVRQAVQRCHFQLGFLTLEQACGNQFQRIRTSIASLCREERE